MAGVEGDAATDRPLHAPFDVSGGVEPLEGMEHQRMVGQDQVAPLPFGLVHHLVRHIDGDQRPPHLVLRATDDQPGIVIRLLQSERSETLDHVGYRFDLHIRITIARKMRKVPCPLRRPACAGDGVPLAAARSAPPQVPRR